MQRITIYHKPSCTTCRQAVQILKDSGQPFTAIAILWVNVIMDGPPAMALGVDPPGSLDLVMPLVVFVFAFGLSMDYEVFLLSRIKEAYDETGDNDLSVSIGLQRSGRIITSAAMLVMIAFMGFALGDNPRLRASYEQDDLRLVEPWGRASAADGDKMISSVAGLAWSPDGRWLATGGADGSQVHRERAHRGSLLVRRPGGARSA